MKKLLFVLCGFFILSAFNGFTEEQLNDLDALKSGIEEAREEGANICDSLKQQVEAVMSKCMRNEAMANSFDKDLKYLLGLSKKNKCKMPEKMLWDANTCTYNEQLIETFIEYAGINVNYKNKDDSVAPTLLLRFINYWPDVVHLLLVKGANPDTPNNYGTTPLMWAANSKVNEDPEFIQDKKDIIDDLLLFRANHRVLDNKNRHALDYAKNVEIERYLRHKLLK